MKKLWFILLCFLALVGIFVAGFLWNKRSDNEKEENEKIDTTIIRTFTDERFEERYPGISPTKTILSMRTNNTNIFVVEYWWKEERRQQHYGYHVQLEESGCQILQEGKTVTKEVILRK